MRIFYEGNDLVDLMANEWLLDGVVLDEVDEDMIKAADSLKRIKHIVVKVPWEYSLSDIKGLRKLSEKIVFRFPLDERLWTEVISAGGRGKYTRLDYITMRLRRRVDIHGISDPTQLLVIKHPFYWREDFMTVNLNDIMEDPEGFTDFYDQIGDTAHVMIDGIQNKGDIVLAVDCFDWNDEVILCIPSNIIGDIFS